MKRNGRGSNPHPITLLAEEMLTKALKQVFNSEVTYSHKEFEYGPVRNIRTFERNEVSSHELRMVGIPSRKKYGVYIYFKGSAQLSGSSKEYDL